MHLKFPFYPDSHQALGGFVLGRNQLNNLGESRPKPRHLGETTHHPGFVGPR